MGLASCGGTAGGSDETGTTGVFETGAEVETGTGWTWLAGGAGGLAFPVCAARFDMPAMTPMPMQRKMDAMAAAIFQFARSHAKALEEARPAAGLGKLATGVAWFSAAAKASQDS